MKRILCLCAAVITLVGCGQKESVQEAQNAAPSITTTVKSEVSSLKETVNMDISSADAAESTESTDSAAEEELVYLTSARLNAVLPIHASLADSILIDTDYEYAADVDIIYAFDTEGFWFCDSNQKSYSRDGLVWGIDSVPIEEAVLEDTEDPLADLYFDINNRYLGMNDDTVYILHFFGQGCQYDTENKKSVESYRACLSIATEILEDFVDENGLTAVDVNSDWREGIQAQIDYADNILNAMTDVQ